MSADATVRIRRALISVSDKTGLDNFSSRLALKEVEILSTGGTLQYLKDHAIYATSVSEYTSSPEIMGGRVKTLHPKIYGGILGRRGEDDATMKEFNIPAIDLVVVNLYPFSDVVANPQSTFSEAIENIDIGGPSMLRAAAKNHQYVAVIVDPSDYLPVMEEIEQSGGLSSRTRYELALKAFAHTQQYDAAIVHYLNKQQPDHLQTADKPSKDINFPQKLQLSLNKKNNLRYGENPHQEAALYTEDAPSTGSLAAAKQWQGKSLSYNNLADTDAALACVQSFTDPACVIVKHANPCGVALGNNATEAWQKAFAADSTSAFGGIIAFNRSLDEYTASHIIAKQFAEVIIAPEISQAALNILQSKPNLRVLSYGAAKETTARLFYKRISGGMLVQTEDQYKITPETLQIVTHRQPTEDELMDLCFAWQVVKHIKSNAIVYTQKQQTIGIGAGQMSRVYSAKIGAMKAEEEGFSVNGSVMASDAFFPFRDGIDIAAERGVTAIIQPGGSIKDQEIIDAANEYNLTMAFTGVRHFLH